MHPPSGTPALYDIELSLRQLHRARLKRDGATRAQVQLADSLAENLNSYLSPEEVETGGRAMLLAAARVAQLITGGVTSPEVVANIIGFAAARMITDGRNWLDAGAGRAGEPS